MLSSDFPEAVRQRIAEVLTNKLLENQGVLPLVVITPLLVDHNIRVKDYTSKKLKSWLRSFPEFEVKGEAGSGKEYITRTDWRADSYAARFSEILRREIQANGYVYYSRVPELIPEYKTYLGEEKFSVWLVRTFPEFQTRTINGADALVLPRGSGSASGPIPGPAPGKSSFEKTRAALFRYVFIQVNAGTMGKLEQAMGQKSVSNSEWRDQVINRLAACMLGCFGGILDASSSGAPFLAFNTGALSVENQTIYGILVPNDNASAIQPWKLEGYCYPGQNDPEGYGRRLCQAFGIPSQNVSAMNRALEALRTGVEQLEQLRSTLSGSMEEIARCISGGSPIPDALGRQLHQYRTVWDKVRTALEDGGFSVPGDTVDLDTVVRVLEDQSSVSVRIRAVSERFFHLAEAAWKYLDDNLLTGDHSETAEGDIQRWKEAFSNFSSWNPEIAGRYEQLLLPFRQLGVLRTASRPIQPEVMEAIAAVNEHFGTSIAPIYLKPCFSDAPAERLAFLEEIDLIEHEMIQLELSTGSGGGRRGAEAHPEAAPDRAGLIAEIAAASSELIGTIQAAFPQPDPFESAILSGSRQQLSDLLNDGETMKKWGGTADLAAVQAFLEVGGKPEITPLAAAARLREMLSPENPQIEKCLLIGVYFRTENAVNELAELYQRRGDYESLAALYRSFSGGISEEFRKKYTFSMVKAGILPVTEAIDQYLLLFLSREGIQSVEKLYEDGALSEELYAQLMQIYDLLQVPFLNAVAFLGSDLQSYITQPEKHQEIAALKIEQASEEALSLLLKSGTYARGSDALSVASRLYSFVGDWNDLAEEIVSLSSSPQRLELLWTICSGQNNVRQMLELLRDHKEFRRQHGEEYAALLFDSRNYSEYLSLTDGAENLSPETAVRRTIAAVWEGSWDGRFPDFSGCADVEPLAIRFSCALLENGLAEQHCAFLCAFFDRFLLSLSEDGLGQLVTAEGRASALQLEYIAQQAEQDCFPLKIYCVNVLHAGQADPAFQTYLDALLQQMSQADVDAQIQIAARIRILFREDYERLSGELLVVRVQGALGQIHDEGQCGEQICQMLGEGPISEEVFRQVLTALDGSPAVSYPPLYQLLGKLSGRFGSGEQYLRFFHENVHDNVRDGAAFLFRQYYDALMEHRMPEEYLPRAEQLLLEQGAANDSMTAQCLYLIEDQRNRRCYRDFLLFHLYSQPRELLEEGLRSRVEADYSHLASPSELGLFCAALEDRSCDVEEYLRFCSCIVPLTPEERAMLAEVLSDESPMISDVESVSVLHALYQDPGSGQYWQLCTRLPLSDKPVAYAGILFCAARNKANVSWKRCVKYCAQEEQSELMFRALLEWAEQICRIRVEPLPWYEAKELVLTIQELHRTDGVFPECADTRLNARLMETLCALFKRINRNTADDANHNTLRAIVELAVSTRQEELIVRELSEELLGKHRNLGLAFACRLLLAGRIDCAYELLQKLSLMSHQSNYRALLTRLVEMDREQLLAWSREESSRATLNFILPDGNAPDERRLRQFTMYHTFSRTGAAAAEAMCNIIDCYPSDPICFTSLFILCKDACMDQIRLLHKALTGLYRYYDESRRSLYTRDRGTILRMCTILTAVMQHEGIVTEGADLLTGFVRSNGGPRFSEKWLNGEVEKQNQLYNEIRSKYNGCSEEEQALVTRALMGVVSGNWLPFLEQANRIRPANMESMFALCDYSYWGLQRSMLQLYSSLDNREERDSCLSWLQHSIPKSLKGAFSAFRSMNTIVHHAALENINPLLLALPWEEHFVCLGNLKYFDDPSVDSCYKWMWQNKPKDKYIQDTLTVFWRLAQDRMKAQLLHGDGERFFRRGEYAIAGACYSVLNLHNAVPKNLSLMPEERQLLEKAAYSEYYQAFARICKAFSGDEQTISKLEQSGIKLRSCCNMIIALMGTSRANELCRLLKFFNGEYKRLVYAALRLVSSEVTDSEKVDYVDSFRRTDATLSYLHLLTSKDKNGVPLFLTDSSAVSRAEELAREMNLAAALDRPGRMYLRLTEAPDPSVYNQLEATDSSALAEKYEFTKENTNEDFVPEFALQLLRSAEVPEETDLDALLAEHRNCSLTDYRRKMELSGRLCRGVLFDEDAREYADVNEALARYFIDYHNYYSSSLAQEQLGKEEADRCARQAALDMALYAESHTGSKWTGLINTLPSTLRSCLLSYRSTDELADDYCRQAGSYTAMVNLISVQSSYDTAEFILDVVRRLSDHYVSSGPKIQNADAYKYAYNDALDQLQKMPFDREWSGVRNHLINLLYQSRNEMDRRPALELYVLNQGVSPETGALFGYVMNAGREPATSLVLQATFEDGTASDVYAFEEIWPNDKIAFAVDYAVPPGTASLGYTLNLSYSHQNRVQVIDPIRGTLAIQPEQKELIIPRTFNTINTNEFTVDEDGRVVGVGNSFFGRKTEKKMLESLVSGGDFSCYRSAIVQGIRRSGKTTLLFYLKKYAEVHCPDSIVVYSDCQSTTLRPVYSAFVRRVLDEIALLDLPELEGSEKWNSLLADWKLPPDGTKDMDPNQLDYFYRALHRATGRGLILIVDEFGDLLDRVKKQEGVEYTLMRSLRAIQCNPECLKAVHLVVCGNNNLLAYSRDKRHLSQMFESYESINVGQMKPEDIREMLTAFFPDPEEVCFHPQSLEWIERYTGGLVWYTKLLVNGAVEIAAARKRHCVYPSDVCRAFSTLIDGNNCDPFTEGCGGNELLVLDAMQSLADHFNASVSVEKIAGVIGEAMNRSEMLSSLNYLSDLLQLIERDSFGNSYHFTVEIYRRYFRHRNSRYGRSEKLDDHFRLRTANSPVEDDSEAAFDL